MSVSSIGGASSFAASGLNPFQQRRQDFQALQKALANGDLSGAQSAFSALQLLLQVAGTTPGASAPTSGRAGGSGALLGVAATTTPRASAGSTADSPLTSDWTALGQALSSGNLQGAQTAFAQLQTDFQSVLQASAGATAAGTLNVRGASATATGAVHHSGHHHLHSGGGAVSGVGSPSATAGNAGDANGDNDGSGAGSVVSGAGSTTSTASTTGSLLNVLV